VVMNVGSLRKRGAFGVDGRFKRREGMRIPCQVHSLPWDS